MKKLLIISITVLLCQNTMAYDTYESYDDIVDRLSSDTDFRQQRPLYGNAHTKAHVGIGMSQTYYQAGSIDGTQRHGGMMIALGVDLLSKRWSVEGAYHNFGRSEGDTHRFQLKEVALKLLYKPNLFRSWYMRFGGGLSSRFLQLTDFNRQTNSNYQTPSMIGTVGLDTYVTTGISFGFDVNLKSSLIEDTIDRRSVDVSLRLDTHF